MRSVYQQHRRAGWLETDDGRGMKRSDNAEYRLCQQTSRTEADGTHFAERREAGSTCWRRGEIAQR